MSCLRILTARRQSFLYTIGKDADENERECVDTINLYHISENHQQCLVLSLKHGGIAHFISIAVEWGCDGVNRGLDVDLCDEVRDDNA
jgi:hypothetical protein